MVDQSFFVGAILSRASAHPNHLSSHPQPTCSPTITGHPLDFDLPEPPALLAALVAAGAKQEVALAMQAVYYQRACEFREQVLTTASRACSKLAQIPSTCSHAPDEVVIAAFKQKYLEKLNAWISEGVALLQEKGFSVLRCREDNENAQAKISKTFNYQYVPLLEHFFEENPFPAHADKLFLAKKTNMSYRQIHVWFQNRRNRTKKGLHRRPVSRRATTPPKTLIREKGKFAIPPTTRSNAPSSNQSTSVSFSTELNNILGGFAPPHAFPTTYPPNCEYDPFPSIPTFITSEWPRRPVLSPKGSRQSITDIDGLTEHFSRLNVWDDSLSRSRRKIGKVACDSSAATSAITVKPSPAPHPACIRTVLAVASPPRITFQPTRANASSLHAFRTPGPNAPMTTLVPRFAHRRKIVPLPKRIPSIPPFTHSGEISQSLISSSSLALPSGSSFGSEPLVRNTGFTFSPSSNSSSAVTTPEKSPSPPLSHPT